MFLTHACDCDVGDGSDTREIGNAGDADDEDHSYESGHDRDAGDGIDSSNDGDNIYERAPAEHGKRHDNCHDNYGYEQDQPRIPILNPVPKLR